MHVVVASYLARLLIPGTALHGQIHSQRIATLHIDHMPRGLKPNSKVYIRVQSLAAQEVVVTVRRNSTIGELNLLARAAFHHARANHDQDGPSPFGNDAANSRLVRGVEILDASATVAQYGLRTGHALQWIASGECTPASNSEESEIPPLVSSSSDDAR